MDIMPETVKCPHCGKDVEKFYLVGGLKAPKHVSPACNKMIKVSEVARTEDMSENDFRRRFVKSITKQEGRRIMAEMWRGRIRKKTFQFYTSSIKTRARNSTFLYLLSFQFYSSSIQTQSTESVNP